jgi:polysaccharide export outer membrane protein
VSGKEVEVPGIGSADSIEVQVWAKPDLSRTIMVRPDGKISLPLIGDVPATATGQTAAQLTEVVTGKLKNYSKEPAKLPVIVKQVNGYDICIRREVISSDKYVIRSRTKFCKIFLF